MGINLRDCWGIAIETEKFDRLNHAQNTFIKRLFVYSICFIDVMQIYLLNTTSL